MRPSAWFPSLQTFHKGNSDGARKRIAAPAGEKHTQRFQSLQTFSGLRAPVGRPSLLFLPALSLGPQITTGPAMELRKARRTHWVEYPQLGWK